MQIYPREITPLWLSAKIRHTTRCFIDGQGLLRLVVIQTQIRGVQPANSLDRNRNFILGPNAVSEHCTLFAKDVH